MTIDEWISRAKIEENHYPAMSEDYHNLSEWLEELQKLRKENSELKRLLKLAMEHMRMLADSIRSQDDECSCCGLCAYDGDFSIGESGGYYGECPGFGSDECFVWEHADEAKGLIENAGTN